ncbi:MAG: hypothetical protein NC310_05490 [Roseburia sp.]|nr:hypothetical protein [Anaeroplasma bactoclasticum]MCM1196514.1 hypothetical protein [Roseburia sp.]MCM1556426.1 hypothetical protein [Anaeroplasma bactoclasticum]
MNRKQIIMQYRISGMLKGHRPSVIFLKQNAGKIYTQGTADFLMTIGKENLYFQRLSLFTKKLLPEKDFSLRLERIKSYNVRLVNSVVKCFTLYTFERYYLEIFFYVGTTDTYETETNIAGIIKMLEYRGIKEISI